MEELMKDLAELEALEPQVKRQRNKNIFSVEIRKLQSEISKLQETENTQTSAAIPTAPSTKRYQIKLNNYAWDQSQKFVKFYVTLQKVQSLLPENVTCQFTTKSLELQVKDLENKDYSFTVNNLLMPINPSESNWKIKSDMILINAAKVEQKTWDFVTETEKRASESKKLPSVDPNDKADPSEGLMSLMKNMYDQGDDEMKRTIAKAWHESRTKGPSY
ncbi:hypothetical protein ILUMI_05135 [Ignelater luminosus]|uniref:Calcyclin-binding protein n=1 Tax=Ignelater luminosus TaxID=2038154 RepID=A0A8K0GIF1_IGNLU|nr:hypothetical protein ILUMI_05135 [Ignelater luminosus]